MASVWIVEKDATDSYCERTNILRLPRCPAAAGLLAMTTFLSAERKLYVTTQVVISAPSLRILLTVLPSKVWAVR